MTIIAFLGTELKEQEVFKILGIIGFEKDDPSGKNKAVKGDFHHSDISNITMQVHNHNNYLKSENIVTEMEFEVRYHDSATPEAIEILRDLYRHMPDCRYCRKYVFIGRETPVYPLSHFFENL